MYGVIEINLFPSFDELLLQHDEYMQKSYT